ncbi:MAG: DNA polymerase I [Simkania negevensis]|nr:DNA polymerase I [Simkania negevensis]
MKKLYLLDAIGYLFRSYYAIQQMTNAKGDSTNALFGFIRSVQKVIKDFHPEHLICVFDGPNNKAVRLKMHEEYKSHRKGMPEDLVLQLEHALHFCEYAGIPFLSETGVEADDLIGAIAKWAEKKGVEVFICSSDKDFCQLISDDVKMINVHKENLLIDKNKVQEIYGVTPEQIVDYLAIMGDASDNIPGIPGFGPKTAVALLEEFESLENLYQSLDKIKNIKWVEKLKAYKEDAFLSQKLAQLIFDIPFPKEESFFELKKADFEKLHHLYQEMNFSSLLKDLGEGFTEKESFSSPAAGGKHVEEEVDYQIVDDDEKLEALLKELKGAKELCVDTETSLLSPMQARLVGIGLCKEAGKGWYIPTNGHLGLEKVIQKIQPLIEDEKIHFFGHNIKYDAHILLNHGITLKNISFDTMLASYLLNPQNNRHNLDQVTLEKFGKIKIPIKDLIGSGKNEKSMFDVPIEKVGAYCCEDVDYTTRLKILFSKELEERNLMKIFKEIEIPLLPVLFEMERFGIYVDQDQLKKMSHDLSQKIKKIEEKIYELAGESFNLNSPKQLSHILFEKLKIPSGGKKKSTRADILESLSSKYPIAQEILLYRTLDKLRSTYVNALPQQINPKTHRIHCTFNQSVAATGRLSSQDPNLQNIPIRSPEGKKIREAFKPDQKEWCYLAADYSQIELRLLAHFSQDPKLIAAFKKNEDIHASTAATVFQIPLQEVTPHMRAQAKAVNFGILYGQQAYGLSQGLNIDFKEAAQFIKTYFENYPKVKFFLEACKETAQKTKMAVTMMGRQRPIPEILSPNAMIRSAAERLAVNTPLQGSQADIIKIAMIQIANRLKREQETAHMVLQIHDELLFELPKKNTVKVEKIVKEEMEQVVNLSVPLTVNIAIGNNWGEC